MFGVYTPDGRLVGHYTDACDASRAARRIGDGARVTSADGGYVVRGGSLQRVTTRGRLPETYLTETIAQLWGGCQN